MSLEDVLLGQGQDPRSRYAGVGGMPGGGAQPAMGGGLDPAIEAQIAALSQPEDIPDLPVENKSKLWQRILSAVADAGSAYAGRAPAYTRSMLARDEQIDQEKIGHSALVAGAKNRAARLGGEARLRQLISKQEQQQNAAAEQAGREALAKAAQLKRDQEVADEANRQTFEFQKQAKAQEFETGIQNSRFAHDEGMAKLENRLKGGDKTAEKDLKDFSTGTQVIAGFENGLPPGKDGSPAVPPLSERLKAGEDPDDIRRHLEDELDQAGIFGAPRDLVRNRFNEKMLRTNRQLQKEAEQQPPPGQ